MSQLPSSPTTLEEFPVFRRREKLGLDEAERIRM
jgi:hypothetical protein